jgi:transcriptional regulator with XRE-family HTH domain
MDNKHTTYYLKLSNNIKRYRKSALLTQEGLALKANISRGYLSQIEAPNCDKTPTLDVIFSICKALKITPKELFDF